MLHSPSVMDRARTLHHQETRVRPALGAQAPGTWCIIGEHTDEFGGTAVLAPLDLTTAVVLSPRKDDFLSLRGDVAGTRIPAASVRFRAAAAGGTPSTTAPFSHNPLLPRAARLISTLMQRQMLSRETTGFDITVCSDIPLDSGLGALHSFDAALGLALYPEARPLAEAPLRARLAAVCSQAGRSLPGAHVLRARHTVALRGVSGNPCVVDYSDGSVTDLPAFVSPGLVPLALGRQGTHDQNKQRALLHLEDERAVARRRLIEDAAHAFGVEHLRLLPDATPRVLDWLKAVYTVHSPECYPPIEEAAALLRFWGEENQRSHRLVSLLRGRRAEEIPALFHESSAAVVQVYGATDPALTEACLRSGAASVRPAHATASEWMTVLVPADSVASFPQKVAQAISEPLDVIPLRPGETARALALPEDF